MQLVSVFKNTGTGGDSSNKGCFGRKKNLFRESGDFAGNRETWEIFREIWDIFGTLSKDLVLHVIYTVICILCMRCILCILTPENGLTLHDMKRPLSNVSNWKSMKFECDWPRAIPSGLTQEPYRCKAHTISSHQIPSFISSGVFLRCMLTSFKSTFHWLHTGKLERST